MDLSAKRISVHISTLGGTFAPFVYPSYNENLLIKGIPILINYLNGIYNCITVLKLKASKMLKTRVFTFGGILQRSTFVLFLKRGHPKARHGNQDFLLICSAS